MKHKHFGYRVFVADDDPEVCRACHKALAREGYLVDTEINLEKALKYLRETNYDIILLGLKMLGSRRLESLRKLKEMLPNTEVIVMTESPSVETAVEVMKLGITDYINKPSTHEELSNRVLQSLEKKGPPTSLSTAHPRIPLGISKISLIRCFSRLYRRNVPAPKSVRQLSRGGTGCQVAGKEAAAGIKRFVQTYKFDRLHG